MTTTNNNMKQEQVHKEHTDNGQRTKHTINEQDQEQRKKNKFKKQIQRTQNNHNNENKIPRKHPEQDTTNKNHIKNILQIKHKAQYQ